eukprot:scaffold24629_cov16-Tisochrysis_lutea.AAC.1
MHTFQGHSLFQAGPLKAVQHLHTDRPPGSQTTAHRQTSRLDQAGKGVKHITTHAPVPDFICCRLPSTCTQTGLQASPGMKQMNNIFMHAPVMDFDSCRLSSACVQTYVPKLDQVWTRGQGQSSHVPCLSLTRFGQGGKARTLQTWHAAEQVAYLGEGKERRLARG